MLTQFVTVNVTPTGRSDEGFQNHAVDMTQT